MSIEGWFLCCIVLNYILAEDSSSIEPAKVACMLPGGCKFIPDMYALHSIT